MGLGVPFSMMFNESLAVCHQLSEVYDRPIFCFFFKESNVAFSSRSIRWKGDVETNSWVDGGRTCSNCIFGQVMDGSR